MTKRVPYAVREKQQKKKKLKRYKEIKKAPMGGGLLHITLPEWLHKPLRCLLLLQWKHQLYAQNQPDALAFSF